jgi:3,4-dihydroxy 2-butanone 4-phosphate synthase/GTP cyclohydrolase II
MSHEGLAPVDDAVAAIAAGKMIILVDSPDRENEGDPVMAADAVTPEALKFLVRQSRGPICSPTKRQRLDALQIPPMVAYNSGPRQAGGLRGLRAHRLGVRHAAGPVESRQRSHRKPSRAGSDISWLRPRPWSSRTSDGSRQEAPREI